MVRGKAFLVVLAMLAAVSCVTVNIYFPAEEVKGAADKFVDEVWGERTSSGEDVPVSPPESGLLLRFGPSVAHAQDIDISTPEIRAIKASMKVRTGELFPYLDSGKVGIGTDGMLEIRTTEGLGLKERAEVKRLVDAENQDRRRLYQEVARANGFPEKTDEVQEIFASSWREKASSGWYLQQPGGGWRKK